MRICDEFHGFCARSTGTGIKMISNYIKQIVLIQNYSLRLSYRTQGFLILIAFDGLANEVDGSLQIIQINTNMLMLL